MPKRKVRTARQRAASRSNLIAARKAKGHKAIGFPTGKTSLLYHRTSEKAANAIVREQKWRPNNKLNMDPPGKGTVFFSPPKATSIYTNRGNAIVGVRISRKKVRKTGIGTDLQVKEQDLRGIKIRRIR